MNDLSSSKKYKTSNWSAVWVLPLVTLTIGAWLAWRAFNQTGVDIQVHLGGGGRIQISKTEVLYKGISVGKTTNLHISKDIKDMVAATGIKREAQGYLSKDTRFWLVKPRVSLTDVTGLEALVSGVYIAIDPVEGEKEKRYFTVLKESPPLSDKLPGLHLTLKADRLGSLEQGNLVSYRQIQVGQVKSLQLDDDQRTIKVKVHIEPAYTDLVRKHTRFQNASGISISGGLSGFKVHSESLLILVAGGIAFPTPRNRADSPPTDPSKPSRLHDDHDAAQAGLCVKLKMNDVSDIDLGCIPVILNDVQVGLIKLIGMDKGYNNATADLAMSPRVGDMLLEGTEFWTVKPSISLVSTANLEALVKGSYIDIRFTKSGVLSHEFTIRPEAPPLNTDAPGLYLALISDKLGSIDINTPIPYHRVRVGNVRSYQLSRDRQRVVVDVHIEPECARLVSTSTRFQNSSGIILTGNLSGVQAKGESLQTLVTGGVSFDILNPKVPAMTEVRHFTLFDSKETVMARGVGIQLSIDNVDGLREGMPIRLKDLDIGKIGSVELNPDLSGALTKARLTSAGERVACSGACLWVVRPTLGLLRTRNLGTLINGPYTEALPSSTSGKHQARFQTLAEAPNPLGWESNLRLTPSAPRKGSTKPGNLVAYRQIPMGEVVGLALGEQADRMLIDILTELRYVPLARTDSRFWNVSGFGVDANLFKGLSLRTESMEALMEGGTAFAALSNAQMDEPARPEQTFALFDSTSDEWLEWTSKTPLRETAHR